MGSAAETLHFVNHLDFHVDVKRESDLLNLPLPTAENNKTQNRRHFWNVDSTPSTVESS